MRKNIVLIRPVQNRLKLDNFTRTMPKKQTMINKNKEEVDNKNNMLSTNVNTNFCQLAPIQIPIFKKTASTDFTTASNTPKEKTQKAERRASSLLGGGPNGINTPNTKGHRPKSVFFQRGNDKNQFNTKEFASEMLSSLIKNFMISLKSGILSIKKDNFLTLLTALIEKIQGKSLLQFKKQQIWVQLLVQSISTFARKKKFKSVSNKLSFNSKTVDRVINPYYYRHEFTEETLKISELMEKRTSLKSEIEELEKKIEYLANLCSGKKEEGLEWERRAYEAKFSFENDTEKQTTLKTQIEQHQQQLKRICEEGHKVKNFVLTQIDVPMMQYVAGECKKLEDEILDYAAYLQYEPPLSSMTYEPKPFSAVEKYMREDLKWVKIFLERDDKTLEQKSAKMTEFVLDSYRKFTVKDEEMTKVNNLKTICVKKFIDMMHKWVDYFDIKRETLIDLRKEFAFDAQNIDLLLNQMISNQSLSSAHEHLSTLKKHWKKVEQNYKVGNFFY